MKPYLLILLLFNFSVGCLVFKRLFRSRKVFSDRFAAILATVFSGIFSFTVGMHLYLLIPIHLDIGSFFAMVIGGGVGLFVGSMVKFHSLLAGVFHGTVGGLMGTMLGAAITNPVLCSLPAVEDALLNQNIVIFSSFTTLLTLLTFGLLYYSLRV